MCAELGALLFSLLFIFTSIVGLPLLYGATSCILRVIGRVVLSISGCCDASCHVYRPSLYFGIAVAVHFSMAVSFAAILWCG